jgi:integrase
MPIRRHGKGWEVRLQQNGRRISRSFRSRPDAAEFERRTRQRIEDSRVGRLPSYSLEEAIDRWLGVEAKALKSFGNLQNKVRAIYPHIVGRRLEEAPDAAEAVTKAGIEAGLKPATINRRLAILRRVARLAFRRWKWLASDVSGRIALLPGEEARTVQATPSQVDALLAHAKPRTRAAIIWASLTGLRKGELQRVRPHDFQGRRIVVERTKTGKPRRVPLASSLRPQAFPYGLTGPELEEDFRAARKAAGMPWLQFRDLRRTCGSWIVQRTKSLKAAQDFLGHTTIAITARHYAHLLDEHLDEAAASLPSFAGMARGRLRKKKCA